MQCKRCGKILTGKQSSYCSRYCSKLHLKSLYKKRNKEKINEYNKRKRKEGTSVCGNQLKPKFNHLQTGKCYMCESTKNLEIHHIKPRKFGGTNELNNLMLVCKKCHRKIELALANLWIIT